MLYFAYGSNLNHFQMKRRCKDSKYLKKINLRTVESEIAKSLTEVQNNNSEVEIGSYPFFKAGKLGVSIVVRSVDKTKIDKCNSEILKFVKDKEIEIVER